MTRSLGRQIADGLGRLRVTQGEGAGEAFKVLPWQAEFLKGALKPGRTTAALSVARGNGKTTLVAAVAVAALAGPLARPRGETVIVASSFAQAKIAFDHVKAFMERAFARDNERWRRQDSGNAALIEDRHTGVRLRALGSDPRRAHGLAPVLVLADEPAQWPTGTSEAMYAALRTSMGKIPDARFWALGTMPADPAHWFRKMFGANGADYWQRHAADPERPALNGTTWRRANPSIRAMPTLAKVIKREAEAAAHDPGLLAAFRALRLNLGEFDVGRAMLVDADEWAAHEVEGIPSGPDWPPVWGVDLGGTAAFSAIAAFDPQSGSLDAIAAIGDEPGPRERGLRDGVGGLYQRMVDEGSLILHRGRTASVARLLHEARERWQAPPSAIAADRWREGELRDGLDAAAIPPCPLEVRGQGFKDGGEDVRTFRRALAMGNVRPRRRLLLRAAMAEAVTISDPAGNSKLAKQGEGGRRVRARDDVAAAAILAVSLGIRRGAPPAVNFYRGLA